MRRFSVKMCLYLALSGAIGCLPLAARAQTTNKPAAEKKAAPEKKAGAEKAEPGAKKSRSLPFDGTLVAIDKVGKTIKVDKRTFEITSETKIFKGDRPATLDEGVVGGYLSGSYMKATDDKLVARSVYFGGKNKGKPDEKAQEKKAQPKPEQAVKPPEKQ